MVARLSYPAAFGMPLLGDVSDTFPITSGRNSGDVYLDVIKWLVLVAAGILLVAITIRAGRGSASARRAQRLSLAGLVVIAYYVAATSSATRRCAFHSYEGTYSSCMSRGASTARDFALLAVLPLGALVVNVIADSRNHPPREIAEADAGEDSPDQGT